MDGGLTIDELNEIDNRAEAVASVAPTPWIPWLETRQPTGGCSFIQFGRTDSDNEIYVDVIFDNEPATSPDLRLDVVVDFLAHAPDDVRRLIGEVRRLRAQLAATERQG